MKGRKAIVLLSDGKDEDAPGKGPGSKLTATDIFEQLSKTNVAIYVIGLGKGVEAAPCAFRRLPRRAKRSAARAGDVVVALGPPGRMSISPDRGTAVNRPRAPSVR